MALTHAIGHNRTFIRGTRYGIISNRGGNQTVRDRFGDKCVNGSTIGSPNDNVIGILWSWTGAVPGMTIGRDCDSQGGALTVALNIAGEPTQTGVYNLTITVRQQPQDDILAGPFSTTVTITVNDPAPPPPTVENPTVYVGSNLISRVYLGTTRINRIYVGSKRVKNRYSYT